MTPCQVVISTNTLGERVSFFKKFEVISAAQFRGNDGYSWFHYIPEGLVAILVFIQGQALEIEPLGPNRTYDIESSFTPVWGIN